MPVINSEDLLKLSPIKGMAHRKMSTHGTSYGLSEAGYDIRIKQEVRFQSFGSRYSRRMQNLRIDNELGETREYGRFVLASAMEEFSMPTNLVGVVHDKSTWARRGLSVFNTVIEPGWKGFLTLELVYHGQGDLIIPAGSGIAQVLFHELSLERAYTGKYNHQPDRPVPAIASV